ncbi:hypothetical protein [uncultured Erythrobacter sp.]|uniref:hypothetical protein n=1 Tax=uncultured Erythrobacter sp. TaxID=263913 RepID=UPI002611DF94|nr:hypothetical protein [uncultured Erythrobacter sp.]
MAQQHPANPYSCAHEVQKDGTVAFECSQDAKANPWLTLPPHHPVVVQTQSFWTAVGAASALQGWEKTKWTALTWIDWELGDASAGHATRGVYCRDGQDDSLGYFLDLFNKDGAKVVSIHGRGVVFRNRNFEKWRKASKEEARKSTQSSAFTYSGREVLGLVKDERAFVAPYQSDNSHVDVLVTKENGLPPGNPLIGGSGDHVNSTHLHEIARQALFLIKGRTDIDTSGEMTMKRYVELGTPGRLKITSNEADSIGFELEQLGKPCAEITLRW